MSAAAAITDALDRRVADGLPGAFVFIEEPRTIRPPTTPTDSA
jgi:hypothetical protein